MQQASGFKSQVAIVVGGTTGMGNAVVRQLVAAGCKTHVLDIHETTDAASGSTKSSFHRGKTTNAQSGTSCG